MIDKEAWYQTAGFLDRKDELHNAFERGQISPEEFAREIHKLWQRTKDPSTLPMEEPLPDGRDRDAWTTAYLKRLLPEGSKVFYRIHAGSPRSSSHRIQLFISTHDGVQDITGHVGELLGLRHREGLGSWYISVGGGGYNKGDHVIEHLSRRLYDNYNALKSERL